MLAFLSRLLLILSALWLFRSILNLVFRGAQRRQQAHPSEPQGQKGAKMVRDPICGMYMDPRLAVRMEAKSGSVYFCSDECQKKYLSQ
jgi:YHS domain-containing protein